MRSTVYSMSAAMRLLTSRPLVFLAISFSGCSAPPERADNSLVQTQAAQEIHRICALPEPERAAEIQKVKDQSGVAIDCPKR